MWICFNDGFVSAVQDREVADGLVVRARRPEILANLFPTTAIIITESSDYRYRIYVSKAGFAERVARRLDEISYPNFKNSVKDEELHELYCEFWHLHHEYQR